MIYATGEWQMWQGMDGSDLYHQMGHSFAKMDLNSYLTTLIAEAVDVENKKTAGWSQKVGMTVHSVDAALEMNLQHAELLEEGPPKQTRKDKSHQDIADVAKVRKIFPESEEHAVVYIFHNNTGSVAQERRRLMRRSIQELDSVLYHSSVPLEHLNMDSRLTNHIRQARDKVAATLRFSSKSKVTAWNPEYKHDKTSLEYAETVSQLIPLLLRDRIEQTPALVNYFPLDYGVELMTKSSRVVPCSYWMRENEETAMDQSGTAPKKYRTRWALNITVRLQLYERGQDSVSKTTRKERAVERKRVGISLAEIKERRAYGQLHMIQD